VWRGQAEHLADSLTKGDRVIVTGRLRQRSWETPEGEKRSVAEIDADEVGASLKFATAKVERAQERATSDRTQGRERQTERSGDFNDANAALPGGNGNVSASHAAGYSDGPEVSRRPTIRGRFLRVASMS
jgi:single-strand DNA-binding protein